MLNVNNVYKAYGDEQILAGVSFDINRGDRLGLVGPNGCVKTTLLRIVVGDEEPDSGGVTITASGVHIGYLEQALTYADGATVGEVMLSQVNEAEQEIERLAMDMSQATGERLEQLMADYAIALDRLEAGG